MESAAKLPGVSAVSMSFSQSQYPNETKDDNDFTTPANHSGVTFLAATGDFGQVADYPASSPNVVAVGGTTLVLNPDGSYQSETAWGHGARPAPREARAGARASTKPSPGYQKGFQSTGQRTTPDVAFLADPNTGVAVVDSFDFGSAAPWQEVGGTSLATPCWAGLVVIANQGRALAGSPALDSGNPQQTLDAIYGLPGQDFHDIVTGNNGTYSAAPGYDELTGRGTPIANRLVPDLVGWQAASQLVVTAEPPATVTEGSTFTVTVSAEDKLGFVDRSYTGSITTFLARNPGGSTLGGTLAVSAFQGTASFSNLTLNRLGTGYTLQATGPRLSSTTTSPFDVTAIATTTVLTSSAASATFGQSVTFTATVSGNAGQGVPTGVVVFYDGSTYLGIATLTGGKADYTISSLSVGNHTMIADYAGDPITPAAAAPH